EFNHLVELQAACVLALALRWRPAWPRAVLATTLAWGALGFFATDPTAIAPSRIAAELPPGANVLAEDASVPLVLGRRPVVLDPFSLRLLGERGLIDDAALARRVRAQEFDALVMLVRIETPGESLCPDFHFGLAVTDAMHDAYRYDRSVGRYHL